MPARRCRRTCGRGSKPCPMRATGQRVPMTSSWGTTETSPLATAAHFIDRRAPARSACRCPASSSSWCRRATSSKCACAARMSRRAIGSAPISPPRPSTRKASTSPATPCASPIRPIRTRASSSTAVSPRTSSSRPAPGSMSAALRVGALAAASPALQDAVVAGENREFIALLAWLNAAGCHKLVGARSSARRACTPSRRARACARGARHWNADHRGSSERIARVLLLPDAPSIDANEITDKGYINQRLALERRKADVERLFAATPDADVIVRRRTLEQRRVKMGDRFTEDVPSLVAVWSFASGDLLSSSPISTGSCFRPRRRARWSRAATSPSSNARPSSCSSASLRPSCRW